MVDAPSIDELNYILIHLASDTSLPDSKLQGDYVLRIFLYTRVVPQRAAQAPVLGLTLHHKVRWRQKIEQHRYPTSPPLSDTPHRPTRNFYRITSKLPY